MTRAPLGTVFFVGAGPGDPGLLTARARELLERADVVVLDPGFEDTTLDLVRPGREGVVTRVAADAEPGEVMALLLERARQSRAVVRLCRGDPLVSGRGEEEAWGLVERGVPVEIVPGVPEAVAAAAYAGLPAGGGGGRSVLVLVRDLDLLAGASLVPGDDARGGGALVMVTTRGARLVSVGRALRERGWDASTPAVCVAVPTRAGQRTWSTSLGALGEGGIDTGFADPVVLAVGEGAMPREPLRWFERRPLFGRRIVVTRPRAQAGELVRALEELGAEPMEFPTLRLVKSPDPQALGAAAGSLDLYDWVVFTSANGVERFWAALRERGLDARAFARCRIAAIGPGTAAALEARGLHPDVVPGAYVGEGLLEALRPLGPWSSRRVLLPRAAGSRDVLPRGLEALGAHVDEVAAYATEPDHGSVELLKKELADGRVDAITFTASSSVRNFVAAVGQEVAGTTVAVIGPVTARTARELGLPVHVEAREHTIAGLVNALRDYLAPSRGSGS